MTATVLTPEAKETLRKRVRELRDLLLGELREVATGEYQLAIALDKARLDAPRRAKRRRLQEWLGEQARAGKTKGVKESELRARLLDEAVEEAAHTLLNRLVLVRILEHHRLLGPDAPAVVTGGDKAPGYAGEFLGYAGPLADDDSRGLRHLLAVIFDELALELPGLFGKVGLTALFPVPAGVLNTVVEALNDPALASAWGDDTTLGWVYQYWNDPEREKLDAKIADGGKIEPHEIASKTQMFTERYMVEWLLQNSLGFTWLAICRKNAWTADAERVLPELDARRAAWRARREAGEVALDALIPIAPGLESDWKYYVPQPMPNDAVEKAPASIRDVKLLDPACGSGHFLVIAFGLLARMYEEEARHRGEAGTDAWSAAEIARRIVAENLHGIDIDARAIQIAAAALWVRAKLHAPVVRLSQMNLVAPRFGLGKLPKDDPARAALEGELFVMGVPKATTGALVEGLAGVDHLGTLLRVDRDITALLDEVERDEGPLFVHGAKKEKARLEETVARFLDVHAAESDLGLRLEGEQLAAGVRFIELAKEGGYDVVVGNPPYQAISKTANFDYVVKNYPLGRANLYEAFLERGLELVREGGLSALLTIRGWMFLGKGELRQAVIREHDLRMLGDVDRGAFQDVPDEVLATVMSVIRRAAPGSDPSIAMQPTPLDDHSRDSGRTNRKRAALLAQVGRHEFDPKSFAVIEGEPIVYWWTKDFLARYAIAPKLGEVARARGGANTGANSRLVRRFWEVARDRTVIRRLPDSARGVDGSWFPYVLGGKDRCWIEPLLNVIRWDASGLQAKTNVVNRFGDGGLRWKICNERAYFFPGTAFSAIGASFRARAQRYSSVIDMMGQSIYGVPLHEAATFLNSREARYVLESLNPSVHFQGADVHRLPWWPLDGSLEVFSNLEAAFGEHESHREPSFEFTAPGNSPWRHAQEWAQLAVDRCQGAALPPYTPEYDPPNPESHISFAIGVALGRFSAHGDGILDAAPSTALPAGIFFIGPSDAYPDSLTHPSVAPVLAAYEAFVPASGKKPPARDWLRKDFFAYHKALYENRPIYFPLSSDKRSFVAWVSIHGVTDGALATLLADHLIPVLRQLDAELRDAATARASSDKELKIAAEKRFESANRLRAELADFIAAVTQCAERGPPPADASCPKREVDAAFVMDLDDGVMINSAALWPLLAPQWSDPRKWWKQLCCAEGRKDYDWAHLARRYFPTRVDAKCKEDPSLAVAHGCFWRYHPAKAFAWELRLQDEIRPDFTIDEPESNEARAEYLRAHAADADAARDKERTRRERKSAKQDDAEETSESVEGGEDDDG